MKIISFEGIEGVGKSTQVNLLKNYLESKNYIVDIFREPGSTPAGEKIRDILLDINNDLSRETELLLMFSSRSELINKKIKHSKSDFLLLDRYFDASMAYQGFGRNLSKSFIEGLISFTNCPIPDISFLLDDSVDSGFKRKNQDTKDRIESSSKNFFNKVRNGYLTIAKKEKDRFLIINAADNIDNIHKIIIKHIFN
ncbi:MAG: dTMP kinase [Gammaproteobacteria bacterium]|nr:dTMP kinase [Gammaproteobacteria bacterium]|tara:strand:+ start:222 stop:812 length:591 start_codon:yes stop_codon:yes gene_type:complete